MAVREIDAAIRRLLVDEVSGPDPAGFALPTGTVSFLLADVEGSSRRWEHAPAPMAVAIPRTTRSWTRSSPITVECGRSSRARATASWPPLPVRPMPWRRRSMPSERSSRRGGPRGDVLARLARSSRADRAHRHRDPAHRDVPRQCGSRPRVERRRPSRRAPAAAGLLALALAGKWAPASCDDSRRPAADRGQRRAVPGPWSAAAASVAVLVGTAPQPRRPGCGMRPATDGDSPSSRAASTPPKRPPPRPWGRIGPASQRARALRWSGARRPPTRVGRAASASGRATGGPRRRRPSSKSSRSLPTASRTHRSPSDSSWVARP